MMIRREQDGIIWLEFALLANIPNLTHRIFLRHGGSSASPFSSFNLSDSVGDRKESVAANLEHVISLMDLSSLVSPLQCHGATVVEIGQKNASCLHCDGLTTNRPHLGLMIKHADCQAAIFYDPVHHAVANVHAGWRGNVQNIYRRTIHFMQKTYGSSPQNLLVGISPSLGPQHAEFIHYTSEFPKSFWEFQVKSCYFDLWEISYQQLLQSGILPHHIEIAAICTYSQKNDCFSYRRENITGRHGTVVALR